MAFDENGIFDISLWESTESWAEETARDREHLENPHYPESQVIGYGWTADRCEEAIQKWQDKSLCANTLSNITSSEVLKAIEYARNSENGLFVPSHDFNSLCGSPNLLITYRRYINGYPTDEYIHIYGDEIDYSQAKFTEADAATNIDLASAVNTISKELDKGNILPPHLTLNEDHEIYGRGIFAWYAKTDDGIIGVVKISWIYRDKKTWDRYYDDKYFIVEADSSVCLSIERDELLKLVKKSGYIFDGEYSEDGMDIVYPMY
jgi:hypothetical protein